MIWKTHGVAVFSAAIFAIVGFGRMRLVAERPDTGQTSTQKLDSRSPNLGPSGL